MLRSANLTKLNLKSARAARGQGMKTRIVVAFAVLGLCSGTLAFAQTQSPDEKDVIELIQNDYGVASFQCGLLPTAKAALLEHKGQFIKQAELDRQIAAASPNFTLSNFHVGKVAEIANKKLQDFAEEPGSLDALWINGKSFHYTLPEDAGGQWNTADAKWVAKVSVSQQKKDWLATKTVGDILAMQGSLDKATYTSYATYDVGVTFQNKTITYKASYLFGSSSDGKPVIEPGDPVVHGLGRSRIEQVYPTVMLSGVFRTSLAVQQWVEANRIQDERCSTKESELCCADGHCGLRESVVRRDLDKVLTPNPDLSR